MRNIKVTVREITEKTVEMKVPDFEYEEIRSGRIDPYDFKKGRLLVENKIYDMSEMNDYDRNFVDYEIEDTDNGDILDPYSD